MVPSDDRASWGGRPVARCVGSLGPRQRVVTEGKIVSAGARAWRGGPAWACELDDGTGRITLVFGGIRAVPGMVPGARCRVRGTALPDPESGTLALWNPCYELVS